MTAYRDYANPYTDAAVWVDRTGPHWGFSTARPLPPWLFASGLFAGSVFLLFQACLGLEINAIELQICFNNPHLPASVRELRIHHLSVGRTTVDLLVVRQQRDVSVDVLRRDGDVQVLVAK